MRYHAFGFGVATVVGLTTFLPLLIAYGDRLWVIVTGGLAVLLIVIPIDKWYEGRFRGFEPIDDSRSGPGRMGA